MNLTSHTRFSGCGAKLGPGVLAKALCGLEQPAYPDLLADFAGSEDAGIFRIGPHEALVQTVDFFPPIVDDPRLFGRIAAANALSDLYAMGARPITALALVCHPLKALGIEPLREMLAGGLGALVEAGCALLGGHSIEDAEPKLGYAVSGLVDPERAWRNNTLRPGGALLLTKPIGTGLVNMALRAQCASPRAREASEASMGTLNRVAAEVLARFHPMAVTDVTGFGLAGHAAEMAGGACGLTLRPDQVPLLPDVAEYAAMGLVPEGTYRNREGRMACVLGQPPAQVLDLLFDPQTSGGLLAALPEGEAEAAASALRDAGAGAWIIGETGGAPGTVRIL
ncbi:selenide, water dikinase SelD [Mesoterricola silvestris]|uniref:Selenide, water dikinase n=1 Tax=Mesoterricola silvestris TaxID=2927979 RepID=A0AA48GSL6_9BACT|nr:selenide, water dikinase SelD [Mesoterricola silvestris]BDU74920.1 selenide, water dikinase SelD [Mesoterricola silvestris]